MQLSWLDPTRLDSTEVAGAAAVQEAARVEDCPHEPAVTVSRFEGGVRHGWDGNPPVTGVAIDRGRVVGVLEVDLPRWDNTHLGWVGVTVDPVARRRGLGRTLFEIGVSKIRDEGRRVVIADSFDIPAGLAFAKAMGLDRASDEAKRRFDVLDADWARLEQLEAEAMRSCTGYELVRIAGNTPDHLLELVATMTAAINDAPTDDLDIEDEVFSPERIQAFEAAQRGQQRRLYRLVARELDTGELAGHTMVAVEGNLPGYGHQFDTSVLRPHRGHRLGLALKIAMLRWLADQEPQLRVLDTWNATSNAHMVSVNEQLGYRLVANAVVWQRHL